MTYRLEIRVPCLPPNANRRSLVKYVNDKADKGFADSVWFCAISARNCWEEQEWASLLRLARLGKKRSGYGYWPMLTKATITVQFQTKAKVGPRFDYMNALQTTKRAVDRLTERSGIGLFRDDRPECLTWAMLPEGAQVIRGDEDMTIIEISGTVEDSVRAVEGSA